MKTRMRRGMISLLCVNLSLVACGRGESSVGGSAAGPAPKMTLARGYRSNPWRLVGVRDDGLLTLEALYSRCEYLSHVEADESGDEHVVLAVAVKMRPPSFLEGEEPGECDAELMYDTIMYPLRWPLGSRGLVHAALTDGEEWSLLEPEYRGTTPAPQSDQPASDAPVPKPSLGPGYRSNPWRLASVRDDGLLTLEVPYKDCEIFKRITADESDDENIVITAVVKEWIPPPDRADDCTSTFQDSTTFQHTVTYQPRRPLGYRKLVHAAVSIEDWSYLGPLYEGTTTPARRPGR